MNYRHEQIGEMPESLKIALAADAARRARFFGEGSLTPNSAVTRNVIEMVRMVAVSCEGGDGPHICGNSIAAVSTRQNIDAGTF